MLGIAVAIWEVPDNDGSTPPTPPPTLSLSHADEAPDMHSATWDNEATVGESCRPCAVPTAANVRTQSSVRVPTPLASNTTSNTATHACSPPAASTAIVTASSATDAVDTGTRIRG